MSFSLYKRNRGFSLVELLVSLTIMIMIVSIVLYNQTKYTDNVSLTSVADDMSLALRQAQIYGISVREVQAGTGDFSAAYGLHFNITSSGSRTAYIFFADRSTPNGRYESGFSCPTTSGSECVTKTNIAGGNRINNICMIFSNASRNCAFDTLDVTFKRPDTNAILQFYSSGLQSPNPSVLIGAQVELISPTGVIRSLYIYETGQISVQ